MFHVLIAAAAGVAAPQLAVSAEVAPIAVTSGAAPLVDHHLHLTSPEIAAIINGRPLPPVQLPAELDSLLKERASAWNDGARLEQLFSPDPVVLVQGQQKAALIGGRPAVANFLATRFARPYEMIAAAYAAGDSAGHITGYYVRRQDAEVSYIGAFQLGLARDAAGTWKIASEMPAFPQGAPQQPVFARDVIAMLDTARIRRAVVLSNAGAFGGRTFDPPGQFESVASRHARVKAENDWTVDQTSQFAGRLIPFCSLNPLEPYALDELRRCAATGHRGLKMQLFESGVDLQREHHVQRMREVFAVSNELRLPILIHVANNTGPDEVVTANVDTFVNTIAAAAPDVTIQVAHLWGGGGYSETALNRFAEAVAERRPATRNMYFDVAEAALVASEAGEMKQRIASNVAAAIRRIGVPRVLFGSDQFGGNHKTPNDAWQMFREIVPLTDAEFTAIAGNIAPYLAER